MGSSAPKVTALPQPQTQTYQTVIPQEDFNKAKFYTEAYKQDIYGPGGIKDQIFKMTGTPEDIGKRASGYREKEQAAYAASIAPGATSDKYIPTASSSGAGNTLFDTSSGLTEDARKDYAGAVQKVEEAKSNPAPAWTPPSPEPGPQQQQQQQQQPEPEPQRQLKKVPISNTVIKGQNYVNYGNAQTFQEQLNYAHKHGKKLEDVSWADIGYQDPDYAKGKDFYDDNNLNTLSNG
jgi:hypothetical protein